MKLAPVFGEVDRAPAAGYLGQVWGVRVRDAIGGEKRPSVEGSPAFWSEFDHFLLVKTNAKHGRRDVFRCTIPPRKLLIMGKFAEIRGDLPVS